MAQNVNWNNVLADLWVEVPGISQSELFPVDWNNILAELWVEVPGLYQKGYFYVHWNNVLAELWVEVPGISQSELFPVDWNNILAEVWVEVPEVYTERAKEQKAAGCLWFSNRVDGTLTIGYPRGILKYPNLSVGRIYEDKVKVDGSSAGFGIKTRLLINLGSLHSVVQPPVAFHFLLSYDGHSTDGAGKMKVALYPDAKSSAIRTYYPDIDKRKAELKSPRVGRLNQLLLEFGLEDQDLLNAEALVLKEALIGFARRARIGQK